MLQQTAVGLIVLLAFAWAAWYWMPASWRPKLASALGRGGRRFGLKDAGADRLARAVADAPGCTACDSCGSCATPGQPPRNGQRDERLHVVKIVTSR
jgi:hypothetical protein